MKTTIKLTLLALFVIGGLQSVSAKKMSAAQILKERNDSLIKVIDSLNNVHEDISKSIDELESQIRDKGEELNELKKKVLETQSNVEEANSQGPDALTDSLEKINKQIDGCNIALIEMATNFLYIPYDEYCIKYIALPAFKATEGSKYYNDYQIRYVLLKSYKNDIKILRTYLENSIKELNAIINPPEQRSETNLEEGFYGGENQKKELKQSEAPVTRIAGLKNLFDKNTVVINYKKYNTGWQETYLGSIIDSIENIFSNSSISSKDMQTELNKLLKKLPKL